MAAIGGLGARCGEKIASGGRGEDEELRVRRESAGWGMGDCRLISHLVRDRNAKGPSRTKDGRTGRVDEGTKLLF